MVTTAFTVFSSWGLVESMTVSVVREYAALPNLAGTRERSSGPMQYRIICTQVAHGRWQTGTARAQPRREQLRFSTKAFSPNKRLIGPGNSKIATVTLLQIFLTELQVQTKLEPERTEDHFVRTQGSCHSGMKRQTTGKVRYIVDERKM